MRVFDWIVQLMGIALALAAAPVFRRLGESVPSVAAE